MPDIPLLGQNKTVKEETPEQGNEPVGVTTAFVAYLDNNHQWVITPDINAQIIPQRGPTPDEMYACAAIMQKDFAAQAAAQATVTYQKMLADAFANQQANMQIQQKLAQGK